MVADVTSLHRQLEQRAARTAVQAAATLTTDLQLAAPVKTGETKSKTQAVRFVLGPGRFRFTMISDTPQAGFTNDGTRPHVIRPRRARALRFRYRGRTVYAQRVNHPGNQGTGWFTRTMANRARLALTTGWRRS